MPEFRGFFEHSSDQVFKKSRCIENLEKTVSMIHLPKVQNN